MIEILRNVFLIAFIVDSVILTIIILSQEGKDQGLGSLSGQTNTDTYWNKHKGRSREGILIKVTAILVVVFFALTLVLNTGTFNA